MTTPIIADAKDLIALAGRMSIPVDEAARQVERLIDVAPGLVRLAPNDGRERERTSDCVRGRRNSE